MLFPDFGPIPSAGIAAEGIKGKSRLSKELPLRELHSFLLKNMHPGIETMHFI
jgi:hypothetical protein